ncbi:MULTISPECIES: YvrJ family protein [unclassified Lysinibacillus]|nr:MULTISPECIES: YvrJ family protein [unclassified Lysinibacillus]MDM5246280.1 YvrJ family protein [Lysinibacillus sp. G4S2]
MDLNAVVQIIGNVGFPIAITIYLLHTFGVKIESLDSSI